MTALLPNLATAAVLALVGLTVFLACRSLRRARAKGCSCGCGGCQKACPRRPK